MWSVLALDSDRIALGCSDGKLRIVSTSLRAVVQEHVHPRPPHVAPEENIIHALATDNVKGHESLCASASRSGTVHLWRTKTFKHVCRLLALGHSVSAVSFSHKHIAAAAYDGKVRVFSRGDFALLRVIALHEEVRGVALHRSLPLVVSAGNDGAAFVTNFISNRQLWKADLKGKDLSSCAASEIQIMSSGRIAVSVIGTFLAKKPAKRKRGKTAVGSKLEEQERIEVRVYDTPVCFSACSDAEHMNSPSQLAGVVAGSNAAASLGVPFVDLLDSDKLSAADAGGAANEGLFDVPEPESMKAGAGEKSVPLAEPAVGDAPDKPSGVDGKSKSPSGSGKGSGSKLTASIDKDLTNAQALDMSAVPGARVASRDASGMLLSGPVMSSSDGSMNLIEFANMTREAVQELKQRQLASALAAYVCESDPYRAAEFAELRKCVQISFMTRGLGANSLRGKYAASEQKVMEQLRADMPEGLWKFGYEAAIMNFIHYYFRND